MSLEFLQPVEHFGLRFDRGSILFEFSALREPEATQFQIIGAWLRARGVEFNEVPPIKMLWRGRLWPDLFIANQLDALIDNDIGAHGYLHGTDCHLTIEDGGVSFDFVSSFQHGDSFHDTFIEPMVRKIAGRASSEIAAKFHRSIWMPIFWPTTLRARKSIPTPFYYPRAGYAGAVAEGLARGTSETPKARAGTGSSEAVDIQLAYVVGAPRQSFSVIFIVDDSPIYRITDMDVCAGIDAPLHRLIVEYRGECAIANELQRLGIATVDAMAFGSARLQLPTLSNVARGWTPRPHINAQIWSLIHETTNSKEG